MGTMLPCSIRIVLAVLFVGSVFTTTNAAPLPDEVERMLYADLRGIETFGFIGVSVEGSAEKLGLAQEDLDDFLRLRFRNNFAGAKYVAAELMKVFRDEQLKRSTGRISVTVWTVGDDYPIAFYVSLKGGTMANGDVFSDAHLGYGSKANVPSSIKESISTMVEGFAIAYFKVRDPQ